MMVRFKQMAVAQLGSRMHYAVPRILHSAGRLGVLYTDIVANKGLGSLAKLLPQSILPSSIRKLSQRQVLDVPNSLIQSFDTLGLRYWWKLRNTKSKKDLALAYLREGVDFGKNIVARNFDNCDALYAYNSAAYELLKAARPRGIHCVMEQVIAPVALEMSILKEEVERWPEWETYENLDDFYEPFRENETKEWELTDKIFCGSEFVRNGIIECGGPKEKLITVPYGVDGFGVTHPTIKPKSSFKGGRPLRVLFAGTVCLRKGAPYLHQVAKACQGFAEFKVLGPSLLSEKGQHQLSQSVDLKGSVSKSQLSEWYQWADIFYLPTLFEGSATVTYEAVQHGLPVITTTNAGSLIENHVEGCIVPLRDVEQTTSILHKLYHDPELLEHMQEMVLQNQSKFSFETYRQNFLHAI